MEYNVELFYSCAVNAEEVGVQDVPVHRLADMRRTFNAVSTGFYTESSYRKSICPTQAETGTNVYTDRNQIGMK
jgi:hypothetical protein